MVVCSTDEIWAITWKTITELLRCRMLWRRNIFCWHCAGIVQLFCCCRWAIKGLKPAYIKEKTSKGFRTGHKLQRNTETVSRRGARWTRHPGSWCCWFLRRRWRCRCKSWKKILISCVQQIEQYLNVPNSKQLVDILLNVKDLDTPSIKNSQWPQAYAAFYIFC